MRVLWSAVFLCVMMAAPALAGRLPNGTYFCSIATGGMLNGLGDIEIADGYYRGPAYDGRYGPWYRMKVTRGDTIRWGGPLGGFEFDGATVVSTMLKVDGTNPAFDVLLQMASGNFLSISCVPK